jgi:hypothetical protein
VFFAVISPTFWAVFVFVTLEKDDSYDSVRRRLPVRAYISTARLETGVLNLETGVSNLETCV